MAKISDIIICGRAINDNIQGVIASNIFVALNPEYIPGLYSFSTIITIVDISQKEQHLLDVSIDNAEGESIVRMQGPVPQVNDLSNIPDEYKGLMVSVDWNNVDFKTSGIYSIKVSFDGNLIGEKDIFVKGKNES